MRKQTLLFVLMLFASAFAFGQAKSDHSKISGSQIDFNGYKINLIYSLGTSFGYTIEQNSTTVYEQKWNPLLEHNYGFYTKEDAYNLAKWSIIKTKELGKKLDLEELKKGARAIKIKI